MASPKKPKKRNPSSKYEKSQASAAGHHFMNLFQNCQMKFFIKYLLRLDTIHSAPPLITGSAFHNGKEIWYKTRSKKKAINRCQKDIEAHERDYDKPEFFEKDVMRFPILLDYWIDTYGEHDLENFDILGVEEELKVTVPRTDGFIMTMRPDLVYRDKGDGRIYVHDTKTSSFSTKVTNMALELGDQATAYLWAVKEKYNEEPVGLYGDIAYWNKHAKGPDNISCYRTDLIVRSSGQVEEYQRSVAAVFNEISQKVTAWKTGNYHKSDLFSRNTFYCNSYAKPCDYAGICRTPIENRTRPPVGFIRVPRNKTTNLATFTHDAVVES